MEVQMSRFGFGRMTGWGIVCMYVLNHHGEPKTPHTFIHLPIFVYQKWIDMDMDDFFSDHPFESLWGLWLDNRLSINHLALWDSAVQVMRLSCGLWFFRPGFAISWVQDSDWLIPSFEIDEIPMTSPHGIAALWYIYIYKYIYIYDLFIIH